MKTNVKYVALILLILIPSSFSYSSTSEEIQQEERAQQEDDQTKATQDEIQDMLLNMDIPTPSFENPPRWKVLAREYGQYGVLFINACYAFKKWIVFKYHRMKSALS